MLKPQGIVVRAARKGSRRCSHYRHGRQFTLTTYLTAFPLSIIMEAGGLAMVAATRSEVCVRHRVVEIAA